MADPKHRGWRARIRHAFALESPRDSLTPEDHTWIRRIAAFVVSRRLTAPAISALEASRPYTFLGSQFFMFLKPFAHIAVPGRDYDRLAKLLEDRNSIDLFLDAIEEAERNA